MTAAPDRSTRRPAPRRLTLASLTTCGLLAIAVLAAPAATAAASATWYVSASAAPGGNGTKAAPFSTLAAAQQASRAGDTIVIEPSGPSVPPLDGGIALKPNQQLIGAGPSVVGSTLATAPRITNTSAGTNNGDAVELASGDTVSNLVIAGAYRGAIYGTDVTGVTISGNDVSAWNPSCATGLTIAQFTFPTDAPGVGATKTPITNGWAGIMLDNSSVSGSATIQNNQVHDSACSDGIDVQLTGTARLSAAVTGNTLTHLDTAGQQASVLAIGMKTADTATLTASLNGNTETYNGGLETDSEGFFGYPNDASQMTITVNHNTFAHGIGGLGPNGRSANGMEFVILSGHPTASMSIANSTFTDDPGDMLEELNWGVGSTMHLSLTNVTANDTTGAGDTNTFPFNNGDCLLESIAGAGTDTTLKVDGSQLTGCVNNGITVDNNVVNGSGPAHAITFAITNSTITGNHADNLHLINRTGVTTLAGSVQATNLSNASNTDVAFDQAGGSTGYSALDLGGGPLGSTGTNCITGGQLDAETTGYNITAEHNWWGSPTGPDPSRVVAVNGTIQTSPVLTKPPSAC